MGFDIAIDKSFAEKLFEFEFIFVFEFKFAFELALKFELKLLKRLANSEVDKLFKFGDSKVDVCKNSALETFVR